MAKKLLILGAGGYGQLVGEIAELCGFSFAFLDDNFPEAVGKLSDLELLEDEYDGALVAIENVAKRKEPSVKIKKPVTLIHPRTVVGPSAEIGAGCVIEANAVVSANVVIGNGSFICAGSIVNHNANVEDYCQVDCNAVVATGAKVDSGTKVESCTVWNKK